MSIKNKIYSEGCVRNMKVLSSRTDNSGFSVRILYYRLIYYPLMTVVQLSDRDIGTAIKLKTDRYDNFRLDADSTVHV